MDWTQNYYPEAAAPGPSFDTCIEAVNRLLNGKLFFLEVGAMDGVKHDTLYGHIIKNAGWTGLLVEPLPDMVEKLRENYKTRSNLYIEDVAITEKNGVAYITRIPIEKVDRETPYWSDGISTLKPESHIITRYNELKPHAVKQRIKTATIQTLVDKYAIEKIDLLQVDTEGYDKEIFDQVWTAGFRPKLIKLEISYMTYKTIIDLRWFLTSQGYRAFYVGEDMVAFNISHV